MTERIQQELALLRQYYPDIEVLEHSGMVWARIHRYKLPQNSRWSSEETAVAFNFQVGYPGTAPYGIYVPSNLAHAGNTSFLTGAQFPPPFEGSWSMLSWAPENWQPGADLVKGANMLHFVRSFSERFKEEGI